MFCFFYIAFLFQRLISSFLFLVNPYNVETVVWKVCFNFLFSTATILSSLLLLIEYFERKDSRYLIYSHILFLVSLFTFELALALPLMAIVVAFWFNGYKKSGHGFIRLLGPSLNSSCFFCPFYILF